MTDIWLEFEGVRKLLDIPLKAPFVAAADRQAAIAPAASAQQSAEVTPAYSAAMHIIDAAFKEYASGNRRVALSLFEKGIEGALSERTNLSDAAKAATGSRLEEALQTAETIKAELSSK